MDEEAKAQYLKTLQETDITLENGDVLLIGRKPQDVPLHLVLPFDTVSAHHAEIHCRPEGWKIVDLGSTNGTQINGFTLFKNKAYPLQRGDYIAIAGYCFIVGPSVEIEMNDGNQPRRPPKTLTYATNASGIHEWLAQKLPFGSRHCLVCQTNYPDSLITCPKDGSVLRGHTVERPAPMLTERYQFGPFLGAGATSHVYGGIDLANNSRVVIKIPDFKRPAEADGSHLEHSAWNGPRLLKHKHIGAPIYYGRLPNGSYYIVSEFVPGHSLQHEIETSGKLAHIEAANLFLQICDALEYAHANKVVHGNLKATNVFLIKAPDGRVFVKVIDFGFAHRLDNTAEHVSGKASRVYADPASISPEQAQGEEPTPLSDIYAFGCLLYHALAGTPPFGSQSVLAVANQMYGEPPNFDESLSISRDLQHVVFTCMKKDPHDRYQSISELRMALARCK